MEINMIKDLILFTEQENPFVKRKTESGLYIPQGLSDTNETGQIEQMQQIVGFGIVKVVGPLCTQVKVGDGIYYDRRSLRPLPFIEAFWQINEGSLMGYVSNQDGALDQYIADYNAGLLDDQKVFEARLKEESNKRAKELEGREFKELSPLIQIK